MSSDLPTSFFQLAYVCGDLDQALPEFSANSDSAFLTIDVGVLGGTADAPVKRIALGYLGPTNIEIIEIRTEVESIFRHALRSDGRPGFHHIGYLVEDQWEWDRLIERIGGSEATADIGHTAGFLSYFYLDRRNDFGHFTEYVKLEEGGRQLFGRVPRTLLA